MNKYIVKTADKIGSKGPGAYTLEDGKDALGKVKRKVIMVTGAGKTEQSHKQQCDMNYILRNYQKTGLITHAKKYNGQYDDVSVQDFNEAMLLVTRAQAMYEELPSNIRERFNGPAEFVEFTNNPGNAQEMVNMGILNGNDGLTSSGMPSGAPSPGDLNGDGQPDIPPPSAEPPPA
jgi:hypothetical protein